MPSQSDAAIGARVAALRKARNLNQSEVAALIGVEHPQIISQIEKGQRALKAAELARMAQALHVPALEILVGSPETKRPFVLWRQLRDAKIRSQEEALFLERCRRYGFVERLVSDTKATHGLRFALDPRTTSFEEAATWAELVRGALGLGNMPAPALQEAMEHRQKIKVFVSPLKGGSGAATRGEFGDAVLINSEENHERRAFSLAHELFHLLTWDSLENLADGMPAECEARNEQLANAFASSLVLPEEPLLKSLPEGSPANWRVMEWVQVAKDFGVSVSALAWRLVNLNRLSREDAVRITNDPTRAGAGERRAPNEEGSLPERYVTLAFRAYVDGKISIGKLAELLETTVGMLPKELVAYGFDLESDVYEDEALPV